MQIGVQKYMGRLIIRTLTAFPIISEGHEIHYEILNKASYDAVLSHSLSELYVTSLVLYLLSEIL